MPQADASNSRVAPEIPPIECVNQTLDPMGRAIDYLLYLRTSPDHRANIAAGFMARHVVADEIERLLAILDAIDGDDDLELNLAGLHGDLDPRLDDAESDLEENEPSLARFGDAQTPLLFVDFEFDPAESGIGDFDGLLEQGCI